MTTPPQYGFSSSSSSLAGIDTMSSSGGGLVVKVVFDSDVRRFRFSSCPVYDEVLDAIRSDGSIKTLSNPPCIFYRDDEGDLCTLTRDTFRDALALVGFDCPTTDYTASGVRILRLYVEATVPNFSLVQQERNSSSAAGFSLTAASSNAGGGLQRHSTQPSQHHQTPARRCVVASLKQHRLKQHQQQQSSRSCNSSSPLNNYSGGTAGANGLCPPLPAEDIINNRSTIELHHQQNLCSSANGCKNSTTSSSTNHNGSSQALSHQQHKILSSPSCYGIAPVAVSSSNEGHRKRIAAGTRCNGSNSFPNHSHSHNQTQSCCVVLSNSSRLQHRQQHSGGGETGMCNLQMQQQHHNIGNGNGPNNGGEATFCPRGPRPLFQVISLLREANHLTPAMLTSLLLHFLPMIQQRVHKNVVKLNKRTAEIVDKSRHLIEVLLTIIQELPSADSPLGCSNYDKDAAAADSEEKTSTTTICDVGEEISISAAPSSLPHSSLWKKFIPCLLDLLSDNAHDGLGSIMSEILELFARCPFELQSSILQILAVEALPLLDDFVPAQWRATLRTHAPLVLQRQHISYCNNPTAAMMVLTNNGGELFTTSPRTSCGSSTPIPAVLNVTSPIASSSVDTTNNSPITGSPFFPNSYLFAANDKITIGTARPTSSSLPPPLFNDTRPSTGTATFSLHQHHPLIHHHWTCSGCKQKPIIGPLWKCAVCFPPFILCGQCFPRKPALHCGNHSFVCLMKDMKQHVVTPSLSVIPTTIDNESSTHVVSSAAETMMFLKKKENSTTSTTGIAASSASIGTFTRGRSTGISHTTTGGRLSATSTTRTSIGIGIQHYHPSSSPRGGGCKKCVVVGEGGNSSIRRKNHTDASTHPRRQNRCCTPSVVLTHQPLLPASPGESDQGDFLDPEKLVQDKAVFSSLQRNLVPETSIIRGTLIPTSVSLSSGPSNPNHNRVVGLGVGGAFNNGFFDFLNSSWEDSSNGSPKTAATSTGNINNSDDNSTTTN